MSYPLGVSPLVARMRPAGPARRSPEMPRLAASPRGDLVRVDEELVDPICLDAYPVVRRPANGVRRALKEEFDRHATCRDPAMSSINAHAIAIADRTVVHHQAAVATPRPGAEVIEVAAFVVDDRRHTRPPQSYEQKSLVAYQS